MNRLDLGLGLGLGIESSAIATPTMAGVTQDGTSGKYVPANASEWTTTMSVAGIGSGNPSLLWLLQEASGNAADSIGSFTGTASGSVSYQNAVAGWTRKSINLADAGAGNILNTAAGLPDPASGSYLILSYAAMLGTPAAIRNPILIGTGNQTTMRINTTPRVQGVSGGNVVTGTNAPGTTVRPWVLLYDKTNSRVSAYTDQEKLQPAISAATGKGVTILAGGNSAFLYCAVFMLGAAELSDAQVKTLLQTLGWSIPW